MSISTATPKNATAAKSSPQGSPTTPKFSAGEMSEAEVADLRARFAKDVVPKLKALGKKHCTIVLAEEESPTEGNVAAARDASAFNVRGPKYLQDKVKVRAEKAMMTLVGCDCIAHNEPQPIAHIATHRANFVKKVSEDPELQALGDLAPYFFCFNFQVPGSPQYATVYYFAQPIGLIGKNREGRVLMNFINGDQKFRDERLKLIPCVAEGSWIVRKGVGSTPAILGKKLAMAYYSGANYFEVDVDVGVSSMAGAIVKLVTGPAKSLVIDLAFLIEAQSEEDLPEEVLGAIRMVRMDLDAVQAMKTAYT